jgi:S1-C subfamily serine protease
MRWKICLVFALAALVATAAFAGEKCTESTQACLNHMAAKASKGWLGVDSDKSTDPAGMKVTKVYADGPAAKAGVQVGDVLVALNGVSLASTAEIAKIKEGLLPGGTATYSVIRNGQKQDVKVTLAKIPDDVLAQRIGKHMLEHAEIQSASAQR